MYHGTIAVRKLPRSSESRLHDNVLAARLAGALFTNDRQRRADGRGKVHVLQINAIQSLLSSKKMKSAFCHKSLLNCVGTAAQALSL